MVTTMSISTPRVCLVVMLALQIGLSSQSHKHHPKVHHVHGHNGKHDESTGPRRPDISIDAFDVDKCGEANLRPWQREQRAFGCAAGNKTGIGEVRVPFEGEPANVGEFPFFVDISTRGFNILTMHEGTSCKGVLIHNDIVLTSADKCLRKFQYGKLWTPMKVDVRPGFGHYFDMERKWRSAKRWCSSSILGKNGSLSNDDLSVILLDKPIEYVPGKIGPACLVSPSSRKHKSKSPSESTLCALAAYCAPKEADFNRYGSHLLTMPMKRDICSERDRNNQTNVIPYETCYRPQYGAGRCRSGRGNPVVCYDKCSENNQDKVQAHVVGLMSQLGKPKTPDYDPISVIDMHLGHGRLMELVHALRQESEQPSETISCLRHQEWHG